MCLSVLVSWFPFVNVVRWKGQTPGKKKSGWKCSGSAVRPCLYIVEGEYVQTSVFPTFALCPGTCSQEFLQQWRHILRIKNAVDTPERLCLPPREYWPKQCDQWQEADQSQWQLEVATRPTYVKTQKTLLEEALKPLKVKSGTQTASIFGRSGRRITNILDDKSPQRQLPSGKHTKNYGKSPFLMGKSTISMAIFQFAM